MPTDVTETVDRLKKDIAELIPQYWADDSPDWDGSQDIRKIRSNLGDVFAGKVGDLEEIAKMEPDHVNDITDFFVKTLEEDHYPGLDGQIESRIALSAARMAHHYIEKAISDPDGKLQDYQESAITALNSLQRITETISVAESAGRGSPGYEAIRYLFSVMIPACNIVCGHHKDYDPTISPYRQEEKNLQATFKNWAQSHPLPTIAASKAIVDTGIEMLSKIPNQKADYYLGILARDYGDIKKLIVPILKSHDTPNAKSALEKLGL